MKYSTSHFGLTVSNLEESIEFYQDNFGFEEIRKADKPQLKLRLAMLQLKDSYFELIQPYSAEMPERQKSKPTLTSFLGKVSAGHLAINVDDVNASYNQLKSNNVKIITPFVPSKSKYFFCQDLDGFLIEIRQM